MDPAPIARRPGRDFAALASAIGHRPDLWWTAVGELRRMAPSAWWRSPPYLPLPDRRLWEFRMVTAYGRADASPVRSDVVAFLEWCRSTAPGGGSRPDGHG
jgi:hypothetical protein